MKDIDAADHGLGTVLQQWQERVLQVIEYASRTLLAVIYALK